MKELKMSLPDDRPITAIAVIEDVSKVPAGFSLVAKTYDHDLDADLWKDGIFGKRLTRYLCLSKTEGPSGFVIDSICIISERDTIPNGFVLLSKTYGSEQKAWRKRQLCYRLSERNSVFLAITDVIILSKAKKAPEGFTMAGEVNGLLLCYKSSPLPASNPKPLSNFVLPPLTVNLKPTTPNPSHRNSLPCPNPISPSLSGAKSPVRPAPLPPVNKSNPASPTRTVVVSAATLSGHTGLEGVPFTFGPLVHCSSNGARLSGYRGRIKSAQEINAEYQYSFSTEREAVIRL